MDWYKHAVTPKEDILAKLWRVDKSFNFRLPHGQRLAAITQMPSAFEVWLLDVGGLAGVTSNDARPVVVIGPEDRGLRVLPISASSLYNKGRGDMRVTHRDFQDDFQVAGLRRDSYIINEESSVEPSRFRKRLGTLTGYLLRQFRDWFGL
jgi:mRNA-degrading endonuclease toxin of MazEF toxin-antitoxin module